MNYDHWKTTNPADEFLGPNPDEDGDAEAMVTIGPVTITHEPLIENSEYLVWRLWRDSPRGPIVLGDFRSFAEAEAAATACATERIYQTIIDQTD